MFSRRPRLASPTISRTDWPSGVRAELRCGIRSGSVKTACTPGAARAALASMRLMAAWACGERTNTADSVPGSAMSSMKRPLPVSSAGSSTRAVRAPKLILAALTLVPGPVGLARSRGGLRNIAVPGLESGRGAAGGPAAGEAFGQIAARDVEMTEYAAELAGREQPPDRLAERVEHPLLGIVHRT